jgi:CubicO group peptidase (beta-lactamase class C family)
MSIRILKLILLSLCMAGFSASMAGPAPSEQIDALFASFTEGVRPGAAVMVIRDGEIVHSKGYGFADLEHKVPISPDSVFRLGSVSKQFTAMAIAMVADRGLLDYDEPVVKYVPGLSFFKGVTIRHLLTHTSGLPDYYDEFDASPWVVEGTIPSNSDTIAYLGTMGEPLFGPGERYEYSNPAYEVLTLIVEAVTGQTYADFMRQEVFTPLGMSDSVIHDHRRPDIQRRVLGYSGTDDGFELNDDDPLNGIVGSGSQFSSLKDFFYWDQALYGDSLVSESTRQQVFTRAKLNDGEEIDYGFGWRLDRYHDQRRIAHGGSWVGFRTAIARYPDIGLSVVVLMNYAEAEPEQLSDRVADIYLGSE